MVGKKPKKLVPPKNAAVIYARYSTDNQGKSTIITQVNACKKYAKKNNLEIVGEYKDLAKSGTNIKKREQFQKMLSDSAKGSFSTVLVFSLDRFGRDLRDYLNCRHDLLKNSVAIRSTTEPIDDTATGQIIAAVLMLNAQMYVDSISKHVKRNQRETARKGLSTGGPPPFGYLVNSNREYVINEEEAVIVRKIFELYASGNSYQQILDYLDSLGLLTRKDEKFKESTIYGIMKNEKYIGTYKYGKQDPNSETGDEQIVIENRIPKIVDAELFDKVQEKLAQNKATAGRYKAKRNYLLSGIIRCGECETSMQGNTRRNSKGNSVYSSYGCPNQGKTCKNKGVRRRCLERFVFGKLFEHLLPSVSLERLTDMMNEHIKNKSAESSGEINKEKLELKKIEIQIRNLVDHIKNEGKSDAAKSELADLENRKRLVEGRIEEMKSRYSVEPISKETVFGLLCQSRKILKIPNDEKYKDLAKSTECRNFINSYVESVLVFEDSIKAKFKIKRVQNTPKPEQQEN